MNHANPVLVKKLALTLLLLLGLIACGPVTPPPTVPPTSTPLPTHTPAPTPVSTTTPAWVYDNPPISLVHNGLLLPTATTISVTDTPYPTDECMEGCVRWFVGLGPGLNPEQLDVEGFVIHDFYNEFLYGKSWDDRIYLWMEVVPYTWAKDAIVTEIAADNGPDLIGPIGWQGASILHGQLLDLKPHLAKIPEITKDFNPELLDAYSTTEGQISLPFALYPSAIFYNMALFDKAGLAYPPASYGPDLGPATYRLDGRDVAWDWDTVREVARRLTLDANGRHTGEARFDKGSIVQYGFTWNFENQPSYIGTFWGNGAYADGTTAQLPAAWKDAWAWTYDGTWGDAPFIPGSSASANLDNGNPFNSGQVAMTGQPSWYTCCMGNLKTWDIGVLPAYRGKVAGRVDADFFVIWKGTRLPDKAFKALTYLNTTGVQKLIIGSKDSPPAYNAIPARADDQAAWLEVKKAQFPWVRHWDVLLTNLAFPDSPSAEAYMPNYEKAWDRGGRFYQLLAGIGGLNLEHEEANFLTDLQEIFDEK